jgi:hypothetical protein
MLKKLYQQAKEVQHLLKTINIPFAFIGGLANAVHGYPRSTLDLDVLILVEDENLNTLIEKLQGKVQFRSENPVEFASQTKVIPLILPGGLGVDLVIGGLEYEKGLLDRAEEVNVFNDITLKIVTPEDLIIMKLISLRAKDRDDVHEILSRQKGRLDLEYIQKWLRNFEQVLDRSDLIRDLRILSGQIES